MLWGRASINQSLSLKLGCDLGKLDKLLQDEIKVFFCNTMFVRSIIAAGSDFNQAIAVVNVIVRQAGFPYYL